MTTVVRVLVSPNRFVREQTTALRRHLEQCEIARGRFFSAMVVAESVHGFVVPRFVSTIALVTLFMLIACGGW